MTRGAIRSADGCPTGARRLAPVGAVVALLQGGPDGTGRQQQSDAESHSYRGDDEPRHRPAPAGDCQSNAEADV
jgi:hypothetical protein